MGGMKAIIKVLNGQDFRGALMGALQQPVLGTMPRGMTGQISQALRAVAAHDTSHTEKALYMAVLTAALDKAGKSHSFNMETQINDLWIKLGNIRNDKAGVAQLDGMLKADGGAFGKLQEAMRVMNGAARNVINQVGR